MSNIKQSAAVFTTTPQLEWRVPLWHYSRKTAVIEIASPQAVVRAGDALAEFRLLVQERAVYAGRALVRGVIETGSSVICEVELDAAGWTDSLPSPTDLQPAQLRGQFREFLAEWQKLYQLNSQYKLIVADMRSFFSALKLWLDHLEMNLRVTAAGDTTAMENEITDQVAAEVVPCVNELFARLESVAAALPADDLSAHRSYLRAQMHPLVLCSPFSYRTFAKPLGYAGDYEMVNMIARNRPEGRSLYAKVVNTWFIRQPPAEAHRNRLQYLEAKLVEETLRQVRAGRPARILNLACGPAHEVREFLAHQAVAEQAELTMLDFNGETLRHLQSAVQEVCRRNGRRPRVNYVEKSVFQLLKDSTRRKSTASDGHFDFVYCAGLFDYLKDDVCAQLTSLMYRWLAPGGLLVLTNVESGNPLRHGMDHLLDWPLEYRDGPQMLKLRPETAAPEDVRVWSDVTGVNVFMEIRKPA